MMLEPPEHLDEHERRIWRDGFTTAMGMVGDAAESFEGMLSAEEPDDDPAVCQRCGGRTVKALGGTQCVECDT